MMFNRVSKRFAKLLLLYGCFIMAFGFGLYLMFHNDVGDSILEVKADSLPHLQKHILFQTPLYSLMKVLAMFLGEIDFNNMPIGIPFGRKDGVVSYTMAYLFIALFMFLMVLVLNNLLNGLAVSDTKKILKDAEVLHLQMYIDHVAYNDYLVYSYRDFSQAVCTKIPYLGKIMNAFDPANTYLLLNSKYFDYGEDRDGRIERRELKMKMPECTTDRNRSIFHKVFEYLNWKHSERSRLQKIFSEARQILLDIKKLQMQDKIKEKERTRKMEREQEERKLQQTLMTWNSRLIKLEEMMQNIQNQLRQT